MTTPNTGGQMATWGWLKAGPGAPLTYRELFPEAFKPAPSFLDRIYPADPFKVPRYGPSSLGDTLLNAVNATTQGALSVFLSDRVGPVTRSPFGGLECYVDPPMFNF